MNFESYCSFTCIDQPRGSYWREKLTIKNAPTGIDYPYECFLTCHCVVQPHELVETDMYINKKIYPPNVVSDLKRPRDQNDAAIAYRVFLDKVLPSIFESYVSHWNILYDEYQNLHAQLEELEESFEKSNLTTYNEDGVSYSDSSSGADYEHHIEECERAIESIKESWGASMTCEFSQEVLGSYYSEEGWYEEDPTIVDDYSFSSEVQTADLLANLSLNEETPFTQLLKILQNSPLQYNGEDLSQAGDYIIKEIIYDYLPEIDNYGKSFDDWEVNDNVNQEKFKENLIQISREKMFRSPCLYIYVVTRPNGMKEVMYVGQATGGIKQRHQNGHAASSKLLSPEYKSLEHQVYICNLYVNDIPWFSCPNREFIVDCVESLLIGWGSSIQQCEFNTQHVDKPFKVTSDELKKFEVCVSKEIPCFGSQCVYFS